MTKANALKRAGLFTTLGGGLVAASAVSIDQSGQISLQQEEIKNLKQEAELANMSMMEMNDAYFNEHSEQESKIGELENHIGSLKKQIETQDTNLKILSKLYEDLNEKIKLSEDEYVYLDNSDEVVKSIETRTEAIKASFKTWQDDVRSMISGLQSNINNLPKQTLEEIKTEMEIDPSNVNSNELLEEFNKKMSDLTERITKMEESTRILKIWIQNEKKGK